MFNLDRWIVSQFSLVERRLRTESVTIKIASPERMLAWSYGEITNSNTVNYMTFKPVDGGLFCCRIFGPVKNYECLCGKYKSSVHKGIICENCKVEVTTNRVRRERMAHIKLALPVFHIWFLKCSSHVITTLMAMAVTDIERIVYCEAYIVVKSNQDNYRIGDVVSFDQYKQLQSMYACGIEARTGAEGIRECLKHKMQQPANSNQQRLMQELQKNEIDPCWMVLDVLPVLPPGLRPIFPSESGNIVVSDLNDLYRRVICCNLRLKQLFMFNVSKGVMLKEQKLLQEAVDALIDNSKLNKPAVNNCKQPLRSLSTVLKGKTGRFRQNLLGKRVDYSGRSVITVGPTLSINQCGIPKQMAIELFKPFVQQTCSVIDSECEQTWMALREILKTRYVLLNRAPTLHRLSIQAFQPVLVEGRAIQLCPLVCSAFNADFDGDQMAVHVPLSMEAQAEALILMLSSNQLLNPANGLPTFVPTQEAVLGLYFCTNLKPKPVTKQMCCVTYAEILGLWLQTNSYLHHPLLFVVVERFKLRYKAQVLNRSYSTTVGRALLACDVPTDIHFQLYNKTLTKQDIAQVVRLVCIRSSHKEAVRFIENITTLGFQLATQAGISICVCDVQTPQRKIDLVMAAQQIGHTVHTTQTGLFAKQELQDWNIKLWSSTSDVVKSTMWQVMKQKHTACYGLSNPVLLMVQSGSRGTIDQVKQMGSMRGLTVKPNCTLLETPVTSNFREGLTKLEYFISAHGARKGLADTALKTAQAGYLTRRLADVTHNVIVTCEDCRTNIGLCICVDQDGCFIKTCIGRVLAEDVCLCGLVIKCATLINATICELLIHHNVRTIKIRSPITCEAQYGVCAKCYGHDLSTNALVSIGEAVGIIAAQSIGEPGTQLTMRTFHVGGVAMLSNIGEIKAPCCGIIKFKRSVRFVVTKNKDCVVVSRFGVVSIEPLNNRNSIDVELPYGSLLNVRQNDFVLMHQTIAVWNSQSEPVIAEVDGVVCKVDSNKHILHIQTSTAKIVPLEYPNAACIVVEPHQLVIVGQILGFVACSGLESKDITQGLEQIAELFEARKTSNSARLSEYEGCVAVSYVKNLAQLRFKTGVMYIPKHKQLTAHHGQYLNKGEPVTEGPISLHDLTRICGVSCSAVKIVANIQNVYAVQGVQINSKHIEVVVKQMLSYVIITHSGHTSYFVGDYVQYKQIKQTNKQLQTDNRIPAKYEHVLLGITKSALTAQSFISAASFQETVQVLAKYASLGARDVLCGLKENVIIGRMIPAGTGFMYYKHKTYYANNQSIS